MRQLLTTVVVAIGTSTTSGQWHEQIVDSRADLRGLRVVSAKVVWASGTGGAFVRTTDGGRRWSIGSVPGAEHLDFRDVEAFGETTAYLLSAGPGEASRIYKTVDGARSWTLQFRCAEPGCFLDAMAFWDETAGLALGDPIDREFRILSTDDGGARWLPRNNLPPALPGEGAFAASGTCLVTHGKNHVWFATGGAPVARVFASSDRGRTWQVHQTPIQAGTESAGIFSIAFRDPQHGMIVGGDYRKPSASGATAARTADGGKTWELLENRLPYCSAVAWANDRWIAVGTTGSHVSADNGDTWKNLDRANYNSVGFVASGDGWAVGPQGRIARGVK